MSLTPQQRLALALENADCFLALAANPDSDYRNQMMVNAEQAIQFAKGHGAHASQIAHLVKRFEAINIEMAS